MRVALVHDMLTQYGGGEKVLKILSDIYPDAPIFTLIFDESRMSGVFSSNRVITSFLQKFPFSDKKYKWYLPLMPHATESYDLSGFDLVISSSSAFAKGVITSQDSKHICYCHTPTRYLWSDRHSYINGLSYNKFIRSLISLSLTRLSVWDKMSSSGVDYFIANSKNVKNRIKKYYGRSSKVIYPPVETSKFYVSKNIGNYFLAGGRMVSYKRFDLVVRAFNELGIKIKIFGVGPEFSRLKRMANNNIEFLGFVGGDEKAELYSKAIAYINPQNEDFGITAVEAMASGTPVIAYSGGGAKESIVNSLSGEFFYEQTWESLADRVINFDSSFYNRKKIKELSDMFNVENFKNNIKRFIKNV